MAERPGVYAVDLGTSKVLAAAAELGVGGEIRVTGVGVAAASGIRRGVVVDLAAAAESVAAAVERAQRMAGQAFGSIVLGVAGGSVACANERVGADVADPDEVTAEDMARVLAAAREIPPGEARALVHAIPRYFVLDGFEGIRQPVGLAGGRLELETHIVSAPASVLRNAVRTAERAGLGVAEVTLNGLASAEAVTTPEERERGVMVVDVGAGCTDVVILTEGAPVFTAVVPLGGDLIRNDIAAGLHLGLEQAETVKVDQGFCDPTLADPGRMIELPGERAGAARAVPEPQLAEIVAARVEEVLAHVRESIRRSGHRRDLAAGVVLTGGGARLRGLPAVGMRVLDLPVRTAAPRGCADVDDLLGGPACAAAVGLLQLAAAGMQPTQQQVAATGPRRRRGIMDWLGRRR
jgi:cell division protein FtsA